MDEFAPAIDSNFLDSSCGQLQANQQLDIDLWQDISTSEPAATWQLGEGKYQSLVANIPGAVYRCSGDSQRTIEFISEAIADIAGDRALSLASIIHPEDRAKVEAAVRQNLAAKQPYNISYRVVRSDGSIRQVWERGQGIFTESGSLLWLDGAIFDLGSNLGDRPSVPIARADGKPLVRKWQRQRQANLESRSHAIAQRQRAEIALRDSKATNRALIDAIPDFMMRLAKDGTCLDFLPAKGKRSRLLGGEGVCQPLPLMVSEDILGKHLSRLLPPPAALLGIKCIAQALLTGEVQILEYQLLQAEELKDFEARVARVNAEEILLIVRDITERKRAESALRQSARRLQVQNAAIAKLAKSEILNQGNLQAALKEIAEVAATTLELERASIWLYSEERAKLCCWELYESSNRCHSQGAELIVAKYPTYALALQEEKAIAASDAITDFRTRELAQDYLVPLGISSLLDAPIWLRGQMVGVLCHENKGSKREWAVEDETFAGALANLVALAMEASQRHQAEATIRYQAAHDLLTALPNRQLFNENLQAALQQARSCQQQLAAMFLDLDRFKAINDTLGHAMGDRLLQAVAERVSSCLREYDTVARWGGDEFTLLVPQINSAEDGAKVAQRILEALKPAFNLEGHCLHISSSIGIAIYPQDGEDGETLLRHADVALYRAKEKGRNNYQFYRDTINARASELLALENQLHQALRQEELTLHYQPQIETSTGQVVGMEALLRWQHPQLGLLLPAKFIPLAEETGLIIPIGEWVLKTACWQNQLWQAEGLPPIRMGVNLSAYQFQQPLLLETVAQALAETQLAPEFLELEIAETIAMQDAQKTQEILAHLRVCGIHISMADFGIGYSSLGYVKNFALNALKIDRSFVRELSVNSQDAAILKAIMILGQGLNLRVIAAGVETAAQKEVLRSLGCHQMQGNFFSPPLSAAAATRFLSQFREGCYPSAASSQLA